MELITREKHIIDFSEVDYMNRYQLCHLFQRFTNIATISAEKLGMWNNDMLSQYGWIVAKQTLILEQPILLNDEIEISTTVAKGSFVSFPRYYFLYKDGQEIGRCSSTWTIIDIINRRIVSPKKIGMDMPSITHDIHLEPPKTIHIDIPLQFIGNRQVLYSDVDTNQHMNNTRYIQWAFDVIEYSIHKTHLVKEISINYKKEIRPLQNVSLYLGYQDLRYIVEGKDEEDNTCFTIEVFFQEQS